MKTKMRLLLLLLVSLLTVFCAGRAAQPETAAEAAAELAAAESETPGISGSAAPLKADTESAAEIQPLAAVQNTDHKSVKASAAIAIPAPSRKNSTGGGKQAPPVPLRVSFTVPAAVTVTADNPTAVLEWALTRSGDGPDTAQLQVYQNGALTQELSVPLAAGTGTVNLTYPFTRYMTQTSDTVRFVLSYGSRQITAETAVTLENWPDEIYAQKSGAALPYAIEVVKNHNVVLIYGQDETGAYTQLVKTFLCSTGQWTPLGKFTAKERYTGWRALFANAQHTAYCYGQYAVVISGNYLFHSVPYYSPDKGDLEYEEYNKLGTTASLGCIRLAVADVKWIYDNCPYGTPVSIVEREELGVTKPEATYIDPNSPNRGWDPTDPDPANPWNAAQ